MKATYQNMWLKAQAAAAPPAPAVGEDVADLVDDLNDGLMIVADEPCTCATDEINCPYCNAAETIRRRMEKAANTLKRLSANLARVTKERDEAHEFIARRGNTNVDYDVVLERARQPRLPAASTKGEG